MSESTGSTREQESETRVRQNSEGDTLREAAGSDPGIRDDAPVVSVPDHELLCCVGRGSYGQVWLARNVMGTYRAVKIVERASFQNARPFDREFNGILKFEPLSRAHPGMVDILQVGRTPNCFYYVMELADDVATGQQIDPLHYTPKTLRTELDAHGRLSFERCLQLALALTDALGHLHGHGLIHRDIKPSNIIFVHDLPKLADIGLVAEQADAKSFVGTEGFIPPEGPGTAQADLYSLGKVLYELATGKDRHDFPELPTFTDDGSTSDAGLIELNAVILKACQPDPKQRYASAAAMRDDLLLLQGGKSVKRSQALERRLERARRITAVALTLALLTVAAVLFFQQLAKKEASLRQEAQKQSARAEAGELAAQRNLYAGDMLLAARALQENNRGRAVALLTKYLPEKSGLTHDLRGWEWRMLWHRTRSDELFTLGWHSNGVTALALSPDARTLYSASADHTVGIWDLAEKRRIGSLPHSDLLHDLDLSSDGRSLATCDDANVVRVWNLATRSIRFARTNAVPLGFVRLAPDGHSLVYRDGDGVWELDPGTGVRTELFPLPHRERSHIPSAGFSLDGRLFACDVGDDSIHLFDWENRKDLGIFDQQNTPAENAVQLGLSFSSDGKLLAAAGQHGLRVWETGSRRLVKRQGVANANVQWIANPVFSPDGRLLVTVSADQLIRLWDTSTWREVTTLRGHEFEVWDSVFTPDGSQLLTASKDGSIRAWPVPVKRSPGGRELGLGRRPSVLPTPNMWIRSALSRDGTHRVVLEEDGRWQAAVSETGRPVLEGRLPLDDTTPTPDAAISGDGSHVVFGTGHGLRVFSGTNTQQAAVRWTEGMSVSNDFLHDTLCFGPSDTTVLFATAGGAVRSLDVTSGTVETLFPPVGRQVFTVSASPDGRRIAAGYTGGLVQWLDLATRELHRIETGHGQQIVALAFSPDGETLATGSFDPWLKLWNLRSGTKRAEVRGSMHANNTIAFLADGSRIAAGNSEGQITLWDLGQTPPAEVVNWIAHGSPEEALSTVGLRFMPDSSIVSRAGDGLRLWPAPSLEEIDRARRAR